jgi:hypothetical protein
LIYPEIATATGIPEEIITHFLSPLTGSRGGITVGNPQLKQEIDK